MGELFTQYLRKQGVNKEAVTVIEVRYVHDSDFKKTQSKIKSLDEEPRIAISAQLSNRCKL